MGNMIKYSIIKSSKEKGEELWATEENLKKYWMKKE